MNINSAPISWEETLSTTWYIKNSEIVDIFKSKYTININSLVNFWLYSIKYNNIMTTNFKFLQSSCNNI